MIPLGLYRTVRVNLKAYKDQSINNMKKQKQNGQEMGRDDQAENDEFNKKIKYVVTNPDKDTRLEEEDLVFVLAKSDPGDPETWDDYNQNNKELIDHNQKRLMADINDMMLKPSGNNQKKLAAKKKQKEGNVAGMQAKKGNP